MLTKIEKLQLIRQSEKCNMTDTETGKLFEWAGKIRLDEALLNLLFKGYVEISKMEENAPSFDATQKGRKALSEVENQQETDETNE